MAKRKIAKSSIKAEATAKAEVVAKATYQRKHSTTEVIPPDVTRAKAGAWLDLISPITEWAGFKGDRLRSKRELFRIQQEETLILVADAVRSRIEGKKIKPVPRKILIPALEKASLEDRADDRMIQRWAELLASASQDIAVQPRFVGILGELAGSQAECLEVIAFNNYEQYSFPAGELSGAPYDFAEHTYRRTIDAKIYKLLEKNNDHNQMIDELASELNRPGVFPELLTLHVVDSDEWYTYDTVQNTGVRRESDLAILESLGLVRRVAIELDIDLDDSSASVAGMSIYYYHLTHFGVEFCEVCSRQKMEELEKIDDASRAKRNQQTDH